MIPNGRPNLDIGQPKAREATLPPRAVVVNVGRGKTIDEAVLVSALTEGRLAGAVLDVFP